MRSGRRTILLIVVLLILMVGAAVWLASSGSMVQGQTLSSVQEGTGLVRNTEDAYPGFTLFSPIRGTEAYLIDMNGEVVRTWALNDATSQEVYLLESGDILYSTGVTTSMSPEHEMVGGVGGRLEEDTSNGETVWSYEYATDDYQHHHDIARLPNGNVLMIAWEYLTTDEALAAGMNPDRLPEIDTLWPDKVVEVDPATDEIVWQWRVWDHLVQDYDESLPNYGVISEHPERIDVNYVGHRNRGDWQHTNAIDYNPELDQIVLSVRHFEEIWIIDHSTTMEEAASSSGGRSGMGGDLLYRWGNPQAYQAGMADDQQLFLQHDAQWIKPGLPGEGNMLIYNNGTIGGDRDYSTVLEITLPLTDDGLYASQDGTFDPVEPTWEFVADPPESFYSPIISSAQRLPNGNTLICEGTTGRFLEVTPEGDIVWEYINPFLGGIEPDNAFLQQNAVFRARRYAPDYPGLAALDLASDLIADESG